MCYVVAKKRNGIGSCAFRTKHGKELVLLKKKIKPQKELQIVTISKPSTFGDMRHINSRKQKNFLN